jgi:hypothetical protein
MAVNLPRLMEFRGCAAAPGDPTGVPGGLAKLELQRPATMRTG